MSIDIENEIKISKSYINSTILQGKIRNSSVIETIDGTVFSFDLEILRRGVCSLIKIRTLPEESLSHINYILDRLKEGYFVRIIGGLANEGDRTIVIADNLQFIIAEG